MQIKVALKVAEHFESGAASYTVDTLQDAFDALHDPKLAFDASASAARRALWNGSLVNLPK